MHVHVPASSANLGPAFDALAVALTLHADIGIADDAAHVPAGARLIDEHHPGTVAFRSFGGEGQLWERCPIPSGRGLGFSGAVRVGGATLAHALRHRHLEGAALAQAVRGHAAEILELVTELEGHADNVAASMFGGVVATAGGRVVEVPLALDPVVLAWVPSFATATDDSRRVLSAAVGFTDAVFNITRTALLVAALAAGDVRALRTATQDRLHQDVRLSRAAPSRVALDAALDAGAWCAWLSGSGPTVAAMCDGQDAARIAGALPADGRVETLRIDHRGAIVERT